MQTSWIKQDKIFYLLALWCLAFSPSEPMYLFTSAFGIWNLLGADFIIHLAF